MTGYRIIALLLIAAGLTLVPWYALQDSFYAFKWIAKFGGKDPAPALLQISSYGKTWLILLPALLLASAGLYARPVNANTAVEGAMRTWGRMVALIGAAGGLYVLLQGFAIGPQGYSFDWLKSSMPPLQGGQFGMGAGALLVVFGFVLICADGIATMGYFRGDRFVASALLGIVVLVMMFVFFPVVRVLYEGFVDQDRNLSLTMLWERFAQAKLWNLVPACLWGGSGCGVAWNTLWLALLCATGTTFLGLMLALIVTRSNFRGKKLLRLLTVLPIITPPFVVGLSLIMLFGRAGVVNQGLEWAFGLEPSRWIYGLPGVLLAQLFAFTPVAFLVLIGVVEGVSPTLEEASQSLHASQWQTFRRVTLPLMAPGLANAFLVGFIESIADFGNPVVLGGNFGVMATEIYFAIVGAQLDQGKAAVYSLILLAFALFAFWLQRKATAKKSFVTVSGKGDTGLPSPLPLGVKRTAVWVGVPWLALTVVLYGMSIFGAFVKVWGRDHTLTLDHFVKAFSIDHGPNGWLFTGAAWHSLVNTLQFSLAAAPITAVVGILSAYLIARTTFKGQRAFEFLTLLSFAIPGTVIGVAYIFAFNVPPIEITGTGLIIVLCFVFRNLPVGVRGGIAALSQLDKSLDEASTTLGANGATTFRRVLMPLMKPAIVGALIYGFVRSMTTVSAIVFLVSGDTEVATTYIIGRVVNGDYGVAIAYCAVLILIMVLAIVFVQWLVGSRKLGRRAAVAPGAPALGTMAVGG
ncbi:MAG: iron ABC transporter permease [Burkholderiales bacterium]|nr:iron ABC transporter permease [Burkholderiales bacterium]